MSTEQIIYVKQVSGAYATNQVRGNTGSATMGPQQAAERLAQKLFGPSLLRVEQIEEGNCYTTKWRAIADDECWASVTNDGTVDVQLFIPAANTALASGPERALRKIIVGLSQLVDYSEADLLFRVPGVAPAQNREDKDAAILQFLQRCAAEVPKKDRLSVVFETEIRRAKL